MNDANPAAPAPLQDLQLQVQSLAQEVRQLRSEVALLRSLVESEGRPLGRTASPSTLLALRNGERLNSEVRQRLASCSGSESGETPTEVDLLIDRLHGLAEGPVGDRA
jgi:hypothetical protein